MHELESEPLQEYRGREPSEEGPLLQRLADCKMKLPDILPGSHNALVRLQQDTIVCLCRLTVRAYDIAQTDEFPLFLRYFRLHCGKQRTCQLRKTDLLAGNDFKTGKASP